MNKEIEIISTHGVLRVDADTGLVLEDTAPNRGDTIARFDAAELKIRFGAAYARAVTSFDILNVGLWGNSNEYLPPCAEWQADTKANITEDLSKELGYEIRPDEIPDPVFWQSSPEELKAWIRELREPATHNQPTQEHLVPREVSLREEGV
jgi:hypothetical protein